MAGGGGDIWTSERVKVEDEESTFDRPRFRLLAPALPITGAATAAAAGVFLVEGVAAGADPEAAGAEDDGDEDEADGAVGVADVAVAVAAFFFGEGVAAGAEVIEDDDDDDDDEDDEVDFVFAWTPEQHGNNHNIK